MLSYAHLLQSKRTVDKDERHAYQPLRLRRGQLLQELVPGKKKASISAGKPVSTDGSGSDRDAAIPAGTRAEPTNSARLIDGPIAAEVR